MASIALRGHGLGCPPARQSQVLMRRIAIHWPLATMSRVGRTQVYEAIRHLKIERKGHALWLTIDNLPLNSMHPDMHTELSLVFREISRDPDTRVVVVTGAGERAFSAGGDVARMAAAVDDHAAWLKAMPEAREIILSILECDKPVIARINGHAMGVGTSIALASDITIIVNDAKIADTHVRVGLVAGDGGSLIWPSLVGLVQARKYLLTGDILTGAQAAEIGLVTEAVPREVLDERVDAWVRKLTSVPPMAVSLTKRSLNMAIRHQGQIFQDAQLGLETMSHLSSDHREAVEALVEKREPRFTGK